MTLNQLTYQANKEKERANLAQESQKRADLEETARANRESERIRSIEADAKMKQAKASAVKVGADYWNAFNNSVSAASDAAKLFGGIV